MQELNAGLPLHSIIDTADTMVLSNLSETLIQKFIAIHKFQADQKSANPEWKMEWLSIKDAPEGFEESKIK